MVELKGEEFDLSEYRTHFSAGDVRFEQIDGVDYLCGEYFEHLIGIGEVRDAALAKIAELHAVLRLLVRNLYKPEVGVIREFHSDGRLLTHHVLVAETGHFRTKFSATGGKASGPTAVDLVGVVSSDSHLFAAATIIAQPDVGWPGLYVALEEIEASIGSNVDKAGLTSSDKRTRFTRTANSAEAAGIGARHAAGSFVPPLNPMTLQDARHFITELAWCAVRDAARRRLSASVSPNTP